MRWRRSSPPNSPAAIGNTSGLPGVVEGLSNRTDRGTVSVANMAGGPQLICRHSADTSGLLGRAEIQEAPGFIGERGGTRTLDPMIKSHVLYRLSYALT
jgi:hypothetical protein